MSMDEDNESLNLITSVSKTELNALAFKGIMAYSSFPQLRAMLLRKFGESFALLLAQPVEDSGDGVIDWYTPLQGEAKKLTALTEEAQRPVREKLEDMAARIKTWAEELISSGDSLKVTRGKILELSLFVPSESDIYVADGQPVCVCWGFAPGSAGAEPMDLSRMSSPAPARASAPPPEVIPPSKAVIAPPPPAQTERSGCLWTLWPARLGCLWLLLPLLALLLLLWLLFTSFGFLPALSGVTLFHAPLPKFLSGPPDYSADISGLENGIADLRSRLEKHLAMCRPQKAPAAPAVQAPAQKPEPEPDPGSLVIPEDAADAGFMQGRWLCKTGLVNSSTKEPVQMTFSFDSKGGGEATVIEKNDICSGGAKAEMKNQDLLINIGGLSCRNNMANSYEEMSIKCENAAGASAQCYGLNKNGTKWEAVFIKLR